MSDGKAGTVCSKFADFVWKDGDPAVNVLESVYSTPQKLYLFRIIAFILSLIGVGFMLGVDGSNHFIFLTYWGLYADMVVFALLIYNHRQCVKIIPPSPLTGENQQIRVAEISTTSEKEGVESLKASSIAETLTISASDYPHMTNWKLTIFLNECAATYGIMISSIYWLVIFTTHYDRLNVYQHITSSFAHGIVPGCILIEFAIDQLPVYRHHFPLLIGIGIIYLLWNCIWSLSMYPVYREATTWKDVLTVFFVIGSMSIGTISFFVLEKFYRMKLRSFQRKRVRDEPC